MDFLSNLADSFAVEEAEEAEDSADSDLEVDESDEPGDPIPEFYLPLYHATQALAQGEIDGDDWMEIWERLGLTLHSIIQQIDAQVQRLGRALASRPEAIQAGQMLRQGLHQSLLALDEMGEYLDDDEVEHLHRGWLDLIEASHLVARANQQFNELRSQIGSQSPPPEPS